MRRKAMFALLLAVLLLPLKVYGEDEPEDDQYYRIMTQEQRQLTVLGGVPDVGDEYVAGDNGYYRVTAVDHTQRTASAEKLGTYEMPDVEWLRDDARPVASARKAVALYCTHSDESYEKADGTSSDEKRGGIYDVAEQFKQALEKRGITVYYSDETHYPHDAGAYRRSRATAANLVEEGVDAVMDIHRDGIPAPEEYEGKAGGEEITRVRLLVGRSNQNAAANKAFAAQIKAVADELYPGLIKDIYIGKGTYNQDLMGQAVLLEFGTYTSDKQDVLASTGYMADVMEKALYGGVSGAADGKTGADGEDRGALSGILWVLAALVIGSLIYAFAAAGKGRPALEKWKRGFQEMTGGLFRGKKK